MRRLGVIVALGALRTTVPEVQAAPPRPYLDHAERETPTGSGRPVLPGRPTVREAESFSGRRKTREANVGGERQQETGHHRLALPPAVPA
jgi:hypothetical protein